MAETYIYPLADVPIFVTCPYGPRINPVTKEPQFHNGVDYRAPENTMLLSPCDGIVSGILHDNLNGNAVIIQELVNPNLLFSTEENIGKLRFGFAHMNRVDVRVGETVHAGQAIGLSGMTGRATGPHLHLTVHQHGYKGPAGDAIDPACLRWVQLASSKVYSYEKEST